MAPALQGCCCLSLRTGTIILAALNLAYALGELSLSVLLEVVDTSDHADEAFRDEGELHHDGHPHNRTERSDDYSSSIDYDEEMKEFEEQHRQFLEQYRAIIITVLVFSLATLLFMVVNLISLSVLIYGAAKSKTACIRQWLVVGGLVIGIDVLNSLVFLCMGVEFVYTLSPLLDTPLCIWLWVVAWSLSERCRDMDRRNATAPLSMAALLEGGDGQGDAVSPCTVAYSGFS